MLLSVTQLPRTFPAPCSVRGQMVLKTVPDEVDPDTWGSDCLAAEILTEGRNVNIAKDMTVYKAEFYDQLTMTFVDVVLISDKQFSTSTFKSDKGLARIYPIFCRKRLGNGTRASTFLCIQRINHLFKEQCNVTGQPYSDVILAKEEFLDTIAHQYGWPKINYSQPKDYRFGVIKSTPTLLFDDISVIEWGGMGATSYHTVYEGVFTPEMLPFEIQQFVHSIQFSTQLPHLFGAQGQVFSPIRAGCELGITAWETGQLQSLISEGRIMTCAGDVFNTDAHVAGPMSQFLSLLYGGMTYDDFHYNIDLTGLNMPGDRYLRPRSTRNLSMEFEMARDGNLTFMTDYLLEAMGLYSESFDTEDLVSVDIHKTWTEDLFIYSHNTGKLLLVIPLVWFMLACTPDVVNMTNVYALGGS